MATLKALRERESVTSVAWANHVGACPVCNDQTPPIENRRFCGEGFQIWTEAHDATRDRKRAGGRDLKWRPEART